MDCKICIGTPKTSIFIIEIYIILSIKMKEKEQNKQGPKSLNENPHSNLLKQLKLRV